VSAANIVWLALSGSLLIVATVLFLIAGAHRRKLDSALKRAAANNSNGDALTQLGLWETWSPQSAKVLTVPERRWTYHQDYMIKFMDPILPLPSEAEKPCPLDYYANRILPLDIGFAILFAAFIVCTALLMADWFGERTWIARAFVIFAGFGLVYGAADVAEDIKLRSIFIQARGVRTAADISESRVFGTAIADAAEVDAANALTRIKIASLAASIIGLVAFGLLLALDAIVSLISRGPGAGTAPEQANTDTEEDHLDPAPA